MWMIKPRQAQKNCGKYARAKVDRFVDNCIFTGDKWIKYLIYPQRLLFIPSKSSRILILLEASWVIVSTACITVE